MSTFKFEPRWKEELVCTGPGGSFVLEMPMGKLTVLLPPEDEWRVRGPDWARELWPLLHDELKAWCEKFDVEFAVYASAGVF
jgi:hypothetical protein